jgi:hypothetical protein
MKSLLIGALLLVAMLSAGCDLFSSRPGEEKAQEPTSALKTNPVKATLALPASTCASRLGGRITNKASLKLPENVVVEIAGNGKKYEAKTDPNGLYGFAGLCAGQYAVSFTPPGGSRKADVSRVTLDGANASKLDLTY